MTSADDWVAFVTLPTAARREPDPHWDRLVEEHLHRVAAIGLDDIKSPYRAIRRRLRPSCLGSGTLPLSWSNNVSNVTISGSRDGRDHAWLSDARVCQVVCAEHSSMRNLRNGLDDPGAPCNDARLPQRSPVSSAHGTNGHSPQRQHDCLRVAHANASSNGSPHRRRSMSQGYLWTCWRTFSCHPFGRGQICIVSSPARRPSWDLPHRPLARTVLPFAPNYSRRAAYRSLSIIDTNCLR